MQNFTFQIPTKILFGKGTETQVGELVKGQGGTKVLLHYGGQSAKASGLLEKVSASLGKAGLQCVELGGVVPNPRLAKVYEGIDLGKKEQVDFVLAVGGGSVIDSAKAIAYGLANDFDVWEIFEGKRRPVAALPVGSVLTIAAAGSETSNSVVITKEEGQLKIGFNDDTARPKFAIMNPELTYTLPQYQTMSGCVDIMMHTMERYFTSEREPLQLTDGMAEALLRTVMRNAHVLMKEPRNYHARAEVMWAGSLSHVGLMQCGGTRGDWASHRLEHELGGLFDVAHGAGLAAIWGSWARYVYKARPERFAQFATRVMDVSPAGTEEETALRGIEAAEAFFCSVEMPVSIEGMGIALTDEQINTMAAKCAAINPALGDIKVLHEEDMRMIYRMAK